MFRPKLWLFSWRYITKDVLKKIWTNAQMLDTKLEEYDLKYIEI